MYQQYPPQPAYYGPRYSGCLKFILYAVSFFIPIVGFVLGFVYISRADPESKRLGQACLIISIVSCVIYCCSTIIFGVGPVFLLPFLEDYGYMPR